MLQYGIIGAMDEEVDALKEEMLVKKEHRIAGLDFFVGELANCPMVLVRSGIGKVNAALCAQILISEFKVKNIINTGVAGAIDESLNILDLVVSTELQQYDVDTSKFGFEVGVIPRMETSIFPADATLIDLAEKHGNSLFGGDVVKKGKIVTGDTFVSSSEQKEQLEKTFSAMATEMEGAAIAHVCYMNQVPFVVIRSMSDKADGSAGMHYSSFVMEAANRSKDLVKAILGDAC